MNWFLYIVTQDFTEEDGRKVSAGDAGVGQCSMSPGIVDAFNGMMYIVPGSYVQKEVRSRKITGHPSAGTIRKIIEDYYNKKEVIEIHADDKNFFID